MNTQRSLLAMAVAIGLTACGGGSGSSDDSSLGSSLTAKVAGAPAAVAPASAYSTRSSDSGYLEGANVCLDLDNNKQCSADEPSATTDENGEFTLSGLTAQQVQTATLLVEATLGETPYVLTAPPGSDFISPITTLIQNEIDKGQTLDGAKSTVQALLGDKFDLEEDYVAAQSSADLDEAEQAVFASLESIAQVAASVMVKIGQNVDAATANVEEHELKELIIEEVSKVIATVVAQVEDESNTDDLDTIAQGMTDTIGLTNEGIESALEELEAVKSAEDVDLLKVLKSDGLAWFESEQPDGKPSQFEYGTIQVTDTDEVVEQEYYYDHQTASFADNPEEDDGQMVLSTQGWVTSNEAVVAITGQEDGSILVEKVVPELNEVISADRINISNLNVREILEDGDEDGVWIRNIASDLVFPTNSVAYKVQASMAGDGYYGFNKGDWCQEDIPDRFAELGNMCNGISADTGSGHVWLQTLASTVAADSSDRNGTRNLTDLIPMAGIANGDIFAQLLEDGTVVYYAVPWNGDNITKYSAVGTWQDLEHNGQTLRELTLPSAIEGEVTWSNFNSEDGKLYLALYQDYIRVTWFESDNDQDSDEYLFGLIAAEFIEQSLEVWNLQACLDSLPDAGYEKQVGDTWVQNVTRDMSWADGPQQWQYVLQHMGSNFSWDLNSEDVPAQLSAGGLTQTKVTGYDEAGNRTFVEEQYEDQDHYYGQVGYDDFGNNWGNVKVLLPTPVAKSALVLGQTVEHETAGNVALSALQVTPLPIQTFTYTQQFLGKRTVEVAAGEFDVCHMISYTHWDPEFYNGETDTNVVWLNNRGVVKQERDDPSWGAKLSIEVASLPDAE